MAQFAFPPMPVGGGPSFGSSVAILNEDPDPIRLGAPAVIGPDAAAFQVAGGTCTGATLPGDGGQCTVRVRFTPGRVGTHTATLQIPVEGQPDAPLSVGLSGEGIPALRLTPAVLDFGTVLAFSGADQDVFVENVSGQQVDLSPSIRPRTGTRPFLIRREFAPDRCGETLAAGATCRVALTFHPQTGGVAEARLVFGRFQTEMGGVGLRGTGIARPRPTSPRPTPSPFSTPNATAMLRKRLRVALQRLRGVSRETLLKRGLVVRGMVPPAEGVLGLMVEARRASSAATVVAARPRLPARAGRRTTIRARLTRAGRRLLRSGRRLVLDVRLTLVARPDSRLSEANGVLRLARSRQPGRHPQQPSP
jgi:hypothetical protein